MAATLEDVIVRLKEEGDLNRNSGANSVKSLKVLVAENSKIFTSGFDNLIEFFNSRGLADLEKDREMKEFYSDLLDAMKEKNKPDVEKKKEEEVAPLGALAAVLAVTIGAAIGVVTGQLKAIQAFAKLLTPESLIKSLKAIGASIKAQLNLFKVGLIERIKIIKTSLQAGIDFVIKGFKAGFAMIKNFLTFAPESAIGKAIASIKSFFAPVTKYVTSITAIMSSIKSYLSPLPKLFGAINQSTTVFSTIMSKIALIWSKVVGAFNFVVDIFKTIGSKLGMFGTIVKSVSGVVSKLFAPIAIVMTLFDTIKGAIDGFAEDGILGGLLGAIEGFFTSLVTKPLDLVKDAVAWVLGKFGFSDSAEALKSFSFTELFSNMIDGVKTWIFSAVDWVKTKFETFSIADEAQKIFDNMVNLVKDSFDWIVNKFETFSVVDEAQKIFDGMIDLVKKSFDWVVDKFKSIDIMAGLGNITDGIADFMKDIFKTILPAPDALTFKIPEANLGFTKIGGGSVNLNPIPDGLYQWAGLTPTTSGDVSPASGGGEAVTSGQNLSAAATENATLAATPSSTSINSSNVNNTSNSTSNNTYVQGNPSPTGDRTRDPFFGWQVAP